MSPEGTSDPRLAELERRWQAEPWSRLFLQLAEEYRRVGRSDDAIAVLEKGLHQHPNYLSAQVALGRARLDRGDLEAASATLEEVVARDPAQLVAGKLLIETYLRRGDAVLARERLEHYRQLNDGDPEIDDLEARIEALAAAPEAGTADQPESGPEEGEPGSGMEWVWEQAESGEAEAEGGVGRERAEGGSAVGPWEASAPPGEAAGGDADAVAGGGRAPGGASAARAALPVMLAPDAASVPFDGLGSDDDRRRYLAALGGEEIFPVPEPEPEDEAIAASEAEAAAVPEAAATELGPVVAGAAETDWEPAERPTAGPVPADATAAEAPAPPPTRPSGSASGAIDEQAAEPEATVTLGQLYLEQRHHADAERIFRTVLDRDPGNTAALLGLSEAERSRPRPLTAGELLRWASTRAGDGGGEARPGGERAAMLQAYLTRIRERSRADVP